MAKVAVLILMTTDDGIEAKVWQWDSVAPGAIPIPGRASVAQLANNAVPPADFHAARASTTRADLKTKLAAYIDLKFANIPAS